MVLIKKNDIVTFLFPTYFWGFLLMRPILQKNASMSTTLLASFTLLVLSALFLNRIFNNKFIVEKSVFKYFIILIFFLIDTSLRNNEFSYIYIYKFIYTGLIPVIILSGIKDVKKMLYYFAYYSVLSLVLYGFDPLNGYEMFTNYMDFGFTLALPAFIGIFIGYHYLKIRWMLIFEILCLLDLLIFANRSATLSAIAFGLFYFLLTDSNFRKRVKKIITPIIVLVILIYFNIKSIILFTVHLVDNLGFRSYALDQYRSYLVNGETFNQFFSDRLQIWSNGYNMFLESPVFGSGIASFQGRFGLYSHNLFLDIIIFFGAFGLIIFLVIMYKSRLKLSKTSHINQVTGVMFLCLWFPKLLFSSYFLEDIGFWCFIAFAFLPIHSTNKIKNR